MSLTSCHVYVLTGVIACGLLSGCAMFRSPDPNDVPKSRYDAPDDSDQPKSNETKPLFDADNFKESTLRRNFRKAIGRGPNKEIATQHYQRGGELYDQVRGMEKSSPEANRLLQEAAKEFHNAADRWPDTSLEQNALFMEAECHFFSDHYADASTGYERLLKKYPNTKHIETVEARRFLIAKYWLLANEKEPYPFYQFNITDETRPWYDTRGHALRVFDKMRLEDPTGKLADDAVIAQANERFRRGEFEKADQAYTDLIKTHPDSEHQFSAHYLGLKAKLNSYRGSDYAGDSLDEGEKLVKQMRRQFPRESAAEREYLDRAFAEIRYKKAERQWKMAEYYYRRAEYGGSRYYYNIVVSEYDDTPFAPKAKDRMAEIANFPDRPEKPLQFIAKAFPEADKLKPILAKALVEPGEAKAQTVPGQADEVIARSPNR